MDRVGDEAEAGRADQYDLEDPVTDVGDGEGFVIARLVAARLQSVTDEHGLLIFIDGFSYNGHNQDTEDHHHCQQDSKGESEKQTWRL